MLDNSQNCDNGTIEQGPMGFMDDNTLGVCRPLNSARNTTEGGRRPLINTDLNTDFGISNPCWDDDMISLQPGQKERRSLGLPTSEEETASHLEQYNSENLNNVRFCKYSVWTQSNDKDNNEPMAPDLLTEIFGEDAQTKSAKVEGLCLDKTQIDIIESTWHCKFPDKLSAYKETSKQSFLVGKSVADFLQVPSLDEVTERLLVEKHGHKAGFGNSWSLFSQPHKSMEKLHNKDKWQLGLVWCLCAILNRRKDCCFQI